jgi:excisionase family DNA binding protein
VKKFYTTAELAAMLGCRKESVKNAVDRGDINASKTPGGHARITEAEAKRVVEENGGTWDTRTLDDMAEDFEKKAKGILKETLDLYSVGVLEGGWDKEPFEKLVTDAVSKMKEEAVTIFGG